MRVMSVKEVDKLLKNIGLENYKVKNKNKYSDKKLNEVVDILISENEKFLNGEINKISEIKDEIFDESK
jgi:hypothetical protein